jgi:hypothetical protein
LTAANSLSKVSGFLKITLLWSIIMLTGGSLIPPYSTVLLAETETPIADHSQISELPGIARNLVGIEPVSHQDLLTVNLVFDGQPPLHNSFILSTPPRFVIELREVGSALDTASLLLDDGRVKDIQIQRHPGKLWVVFDLTSLDGISYLLKAETNRLVASFKIYTEHPQSPLAELSETAPVSLDDDGSEEIESGGKVEEDPTLTRAQQDNAIDLQNNDTPVDVGMQPETNTLSGQQEIPQSELDKFLQEPSGAYPELDAFLKELSKGFSFEFRVLANQRLSNVSDSPINPGNVLEIPKYIFSLDFRPDFYLNYRVFRLMVKPRSTLTWTRIEDGVSDGDNDWDNDLFVNEWLAGVQATGSLFLSYGRENLQWGPSSLLSPSNPFFLDNGLRNPKLEVRGQDFGRILWVPSSSWTISAIANTGEGANDLIEDFEPAYALKVDYTGYRKYFSIIPSYREKDRARLGAFAGWTVSDGLLLYAEATTAQGNSVLYPVETGQLTPSGNPIITLEQTKDKSNSFQTTALFGTAYTFELGPTLSLEYLYNQPGYDDDQIDSLLDFTSGLGRIIGIIPPDLINRVFDLSQFTDIGLPLFRKHYLNFQYQHPQLFDDLSLGFRYTFNLDDQGSQMIPVVQFDLDDNVQLFFVGTINFGSKRDEFRFFVEDSYFFGMQYTF